MIYYFSIELRHAKLHHLINFNTSRCTLIVTTCIKRIAKIVFAIKILYLFLNQIFIL